MSRPLVFAFGSNMSTAQMRERCPSARVLGRATLPGHRLAFAGWSRRWGGAVATVRRSASSSCPGLLYELSHLDLARLDLFEGAPRAYQRRRYSVRLEGGLHAVAWVYQLVSREPALPSAAYVTRIGRAYRDFKINPRPLKRAVALAYIATRWEGLPA